MSIEELKIGEPATSVESSGNKNQYEQVSEAMKLELTPEEITIINEAEPEGKIVDEDEVLAIYKKLLQNYPEKGLEFAARAVFSRINYDIGVKLIQEIVQVKGWDYLINELMEDSGKFGLPRSEAGAIMLHDFMLSLGSMRSLPLEKIEKALQQTKNDIEWASIRSYADFRKKVDSMDNISSIEAADMLTHYDVPYWRVEEVKNIASEIIEQDDYEYSLLLEDLYGRMYAAYDQETANEQLKKWQQMTAEELMSSIAPVYAFNIAVRYIPHEEMKEKYVFSENEVKAEAKALMKEHDEAFLRIAWREEHRNKAPYFLNDLFDRYNLIPVLGKYADEEGKKTNEEKFGYAVNCTAIAISSDIIGVYSPTGRFLFSFQTEDEESKKAPFNNTMEIMSMAHMITTESDKRVAYQPQVSAFIACLSHWEVIPKELRKALTEHLSRFKVDIEELLEIANDDYDTVLDRVFDEYQPIIPGELYEITADFTMKELEKRYTSLPLNLLTPEEISKEINKKYGSREYKPEEVYELLEISGFETIRYIKEALKLELSKISTRELFSLLLFLENSRGGKGVNDLRQIIGQAENEEAKANRVKAFLSLEQNEKMGEVIINIGEQLKEQPETADRLFKEYARIVDNANRTSEKTSELYNKIFFKKQLDKEELAGTILVRAAELIAEAGTSLEGAKDEKEKRAIIEELIRKINDQEEKREKSLKEFEEVQKELNALYKSIEKNIERASLGDYFDPEVQEIEEELKEAMEGWEEAKGFNKFDAASVKDMISYYNHIYEAIQKKIEDADESAAEQYFRTEHPDRVDEHINFYKKMKAREVKIAEKMGKILADLNKLLQYQENFERKLEEVIYGKESASLPERYLEEIEKDILNYQPEMEIGEKEPYLPVGVSSQLPLAGEVHAKPIDIYAYLFWLQNQGKKSGLMIADTMQETNYRAFNSDLSPEEARDLARINGERDREIYQAAIRVFDLDNVSIVNYENEIENNPKMRECLALVERLDSGERGEKSEAISRAFNSLVEGKVRKRALEALEEKKGKGAETKDKQEIDKLLKQYGKTEIAWILAQKGVKIGHEKEYRYDILARIIPIYQALKEKKGELKNLMGEVLTAKGVKKGLKERIISDLDKDQTLVELSLYLGYYKDYPPEQQKTFELFSETYDEAVGKESQLNSQSKDLKRLEEEKEKSPADKAAEIEKRLSGLKAKVEAQSREKERLMLEASKIKNQLERFLVEDEKLKILKAIDLEAKDILKLTKKESVEIVGRLGALGRKITEKEWFKELELPEFFYPQGVAGMSFEMRSGKEDEADERKTTGFRKGGSGKEHSGFKEGYSTIKGKKEEEKILPFQATQVIASTDKLAAAKLSILSEETQREYFNKVLRPLLVNYYLATTKDKEDAAKKAGEDLEHIHTISEAIEVIQKKIVWPVEMELGS